MQNSSKNLIRLGLYCHTILRTNIAKSFVLRFVMQEVHVYTSEKAGVLQNTMFSYWSNEDPEIQYCEFYIG